MKEAYDKAAMYFPLGEILTAIRIGTYRRG